MQNTITVKIHIKDLGAITLELYPEVAPKTVENFIDYVKQGYYNGLIFHRVIKNFMIQGGGGKNSHSPIEGEFISNGIKNDLKHTAGVISMARTQDKNSATSQFFIVHRDAPHLDGHYAAFGKTLSGFEIIDHIAHVKTDAYDKPLVDIVIESISL